MADDKRYTERDLILAKREGYAKGLSALYSTRDERVAEFEAAARYPMPTVTRVRRVPDPNGVPGLLWTFQDGRLVPWMSGFNSQDSTPYPMTAERIRMAYDLMQHPTEEVGA